MAKKKESLQAETERLYGLYKVDPVQSAVLKNLFQIAGLCGPSKSAPPPKEDSYGTYVSEGSTDAEGED